jgi:MEMO1 family protein
MSPLPRRPVVAGHFYAGDGAALAHQIEACFLSERGPGELPPRQRSGERRIRAVVVPHAAYEFSGAIAALAYHAVAAERAPESVLVLGADHQGFAGAPALSGVPWQTPLGPTPIAEELLAALRHPPLEVDEAAHSAEHSIEVQLPFLEYVLPHPRFVPLEVPFVGLAALERTAAVVRAAIHGRDTLVVASTDFSHYVPARVAEELDRHAIDAILARDGRRLFETVTAEGITMCGLAPAVVLLAALAGEPLGARLLRWGHSGEVGRMRDVVGYASLVLEASTALPPSVK